MGPLAQVGARRLVKLARRGDRLRRRSLTRFAALAASHDIAPRQLRLLADAWAAGGRSGLRALGPATPVTDPAVMAWAVEMVEAWRRRHFPFDALEPDVWRNRLTVWWLQPGDTPTAALRRHPLLQVRRTPDGRWHLYRRAAQGEWWPVVLHGRRARQSLAACLNAVRLDAVGEFWGAGGPATPDDV